MPSTLSVAVGSLVGLWVAMTVLCAPVLASGSVRRLLDAGPTDSLVVNYVVGVGTVALLHVVLIFSGALVNQLVRVDITWWFLGTTLVLVGGGWTGVSIGLPRRGLWDPADARVDGRIVLAVAAVWYGVWTVGLAALFAFAWFLAFYPGG